MTEFEKWWKTILAEELPDKISARQNMELARAAWNAALESALRMLANKAALVRAEKHDALTEEAAFVAIPDLTDDQLAWYVGDYAPKGKHADPVVHAALVAEVERRMERDRAGVGK